MPDYLHPGVYIEETELGPRPIEGVPTSTAAFLGEAERGSTRPRLVTSYRDYQRWFGDVFADGMFLPDAVRGFFENGGKRAFICRIVGDGAQPGADDYEGLPLTGRPAPQGLAALELDPCREVALVYAPNVATAIVRRIVEHCETQRFRFAVVDAPKGQVDPAELSPRNQIKDTEYAAFYYPWIVTSDPKTGARKLVPPGGHMLGVYARVDTERGVHKSPANEVLRGVLDLEYDINQTMQDDLNPKGVNVIRRFPGRGIRVWGARTLSSSSLWKYVSVRRLFIFLERSIYEGTQWVIFEPNDDRLWARVADRIRLFLRGLWCNGALLGRKEQEAFFVTCDGTTMTQDDILNGRLICVIGVAPVRPAEFVVFRIFQHTAEAER